MAKVTESNSIQFEYNFNKPEEGFRISIGNTRESSSKFNEKARYHLNVTEIRDLYETLGELINNMK